VLSIVIATRNRASSLRQTLASLGRLAIPSGGCEIVVVDNGSSDDTPAVVAEFARVSAISTRYVREPRGGKSNAVNAGVAVARGDLLAFTDDDVQVDESWAVAFARARERTDCIGFGGRIIAQWSMPPPRWIAADGPGRLMTVVAFDEGLSSRYLSAPPFGPNMAFRRVAFERYGLFRVDLGPAVGRYLPGQDTEFGRRLMNGGERLWWVPDAIVEHVLQPDKMTKRYVASWYFRYGRMSVRTEGAPAGSVVYFGVPRHQLRRLVVGFGRWAACPDPQRRFRHYADLCRIVGEITESLVGGRP
jgi:glycosyltransferase involved in cell wall biosynthesis